MAYNTDEKRREAERQMQEELSGVHEYGGFIIRKQDSYGMYRVERKEGATPKSLLGLWTDKTEAMAAIDRITKEPATSK